jgi:polar amino acid transport system permease protein
VFPRHVVLPQGLRYAIPSWTNEFVYLIEYSSLAAFITMPKLCYRADQIASETFRYALIFTVTGVTYLALVLTASKLMACVEGTVAVLGLGAERAE